MTETRERKQVEVRPAYIDPVREEAREAAWKGYCELLAARYPFEKVELNFLDMRSLRYCMLGQGYGTYEKGLEILAHDLIARGGDEEQYAAKHGFNAHSCMLEQEHYYDCLDEAWTELVEQHRTCGRAYGW